MPTARSLERLRQLGPVFRSRDAVAAGVSWRDLYDLRDSGAIVELSRGVYQLSDVAGATSIDFVAVCARAPRGMICLNSALAHWDLSDEIPSEVHLAVPQDSHRPLIDFPPTRVHVFRSTTFDLGRLEVTLEDGARFSITDRERSVVDAFRLRHLVGEDMAYEALRRYLSDRPRRARIVELARSFRVSAQMTDAIRLLQA